MVHSMPPPDQAMASALRRLREARDITQEALAYESNITISALSRIERGLSNPSWTTLVQLAQALGVTPAELVGATEDDRRRERAAMN